MKTFIENILIVAILFLGMQLSASAMAESIYGKGGKIVLPGGTVKYCPDEDTKKCAYIQTNSSGNPSYPDLLDVYGPTGIVIETWDVIFISVGTNFQSIIVQEGGLHQGGSIFPLHLENNVNKTKDKQN